MSYLKMCVVFYKLSPAGTYPGHATHGKESCFCYTASPKPSSNDPPWSEENSTCCCDCSLLSWKIFFKKCYLYSKNRPEDSNCLLLLSHGSMPCKLCDITDCNVVLVISDPCIIVVRACLRLTEKSLVHSGFWWVLILFRLCS